ncbi:MAG: hypothetical protein HPM95_10790 [Alphaproteobacteria bacterium]|nr:hypothetical protein [Alphaproteobacteria bacterium]
MALLVLLEVDAVAGRAGARPLSVVVPVKPNVAAAGDRDGVVAGVRRA